MQNCVPFTKLFAWKKYTMHPKFRMGHGSAEIRLMSSQISKLVKFGKASQREGGHRCVFGIPKLWKQKRGLDKFDKFSEQFPSGFQIWTQRLSTTVHFQLS